MMDKKIIFLDIDGTLTLPSGIVSDKVQESIRKVRENGHYVFLCTGRNKAGVRALMPIGFDGAICSAGGYIELNGQKIYESCLTDDDLNYARNIFERNHILYNLETTEMTFQGDEMNKAFIAQQLNEQTLNSEMIRLINEQKDRFNIHSIDEFDMNPIPVQKLCFLAQNEDDVRELRELLSDKFNMIIHELFTKDVINGEIIIKGTNKGNAIKYVVDYLGLDIKDTIGFGDSMNDLEMIQTCEYGVVMDNGSIQLKEHASKICESVENDGVYHELRRLGLLS